MYLFLKIFIWESVQAGVGGADGEEEADPWIMIRRSTDGATQVP